jgi:hypothetical protein
VNQPNKYIILKAVHRGALEDIVNDHIHMGYAPIGGVEVVQVLLNSDRDVFDYTMRYYQAMVRDET